MSGTMRVGRQTAIRVFAHEYRDASLPDQGSGEYDPGYMVTRPVSYTHLTLPTICSV